MEQQQTHQEADWKQQQARQEAALKLHQQRLDRVMALSEAEVGNALAGLCKMMGLEHTKQKLELQRQVSDLTLSLQEREAQIRDLQVARHVRGATAEALRRATLEVTALQSRALEEKMSELNVEGQLTDLQARFSDSEKQNGQLVIQVATLGAELQEASRRSVLLLKEKDRLQELHEAQLKELRAELGSATEKRISALLVSHTDSEKALQRKLEVTALQSRAQEKGRLQQLHVAQLKELRAELGSATEKQISALRVSHTDSEKALQRKLEEGCQELRAMQGDMEKAQQESSSLAELRMRLGSMEAELELRSGQVTSLTGQLEQAVAEKNQLEQQVDSITSLLEAAQAGTWWTRRPW